MRELIGSAPGVIQRVLDFPLLLVDIVRIPEDKLKGSPVLQALLLALRSATIGNYEERLPKIMRILAGSDKNVLLRFRMEAMAHYSLDRCESKRSFEVITSAYEQAFGAKGAKLMGKSLAEQWFDEGMEKGKTEGALKNLLDILTARFGAVPVLLKRQLSKNSDMDDLERLVVLAATCESMDEFKRAADEMKSGNKK